MICNRLFKPGNAAILQLRSAALRHFASTTIRSKRVCKDDNPRLLYQNITDDSHNKRKKALVRFLGSLDDVGIQGSLKTVRTTTAMSILRCREGQVHEPKPISAAWPTRFLKQYRNQLTLQRDVVQELDLVAAEDPVDIRAWFNDLKSKYDRLCLKLADVYNVDEIGFQMGIGKPQHVVTRALPAAKVGKQRKRRNRKQISSSKNTTRETASVLEHVSAARAVQF